MTPTVLIRTTYRLLLVSVSVSALLIVNAPLAIGQPAGAPSREAIRALNLSRSQMQQLRGVMQRYQASVEDILNRDQREQLETLQAQQRRQPSSNTRPNLVAQLNLSRDQANRIDDLEARMAEDLRAILTPSQLQQAQQLGLPGL